MRKSTGPLTTMIMVALFFSATSLWAVEPFMADYTCYPVFQANAVAPNIVILLDNGAEMEQIIRHDAFDNRIDCTPKVGSEVEFVNGFYNENGYMIIKAATNKYYLAPILSDLTPDTDYANCLFSASNTFAITGLTITLPYEPSASVDGDGIKDSAARFRYSRNYLNWIFFTKGPGSYVEASAVDDGTDLPSKSRFYFAKKAIFTVSKLTSNKARFGIFNFTTNANGASNVQPLKGDVVTTLAADPENNVLDPNFVNSINNMGTVTYSPLAEGLAQIGGYYASSSSGAVQYDCQDSFVVVISPGVSSEDQGINGPSYEPQVFSDADDGDNTADGGIGEGNIKADPVLALSQIPVNQNGSAKLDDVAHYLYTNGIVSNGQNLATYTIGFMGNQLSNLFLINTSNNGNGNVNLYDTTDPEYGRYHFAAEDPGQLANAILVAITDILARVASGTALSVLSTSGEGEGILVQAYFRPTIPTGTSEVKWAGYLQGLWIDPFGNLREDTDGDRGLDVKVDKVVTFFLDTGTGDTKIKRFTVTAADPYPDIDSDPYEVLDLGGIASLWEAGSQLHQRNASDRNLFTYVDKDKDGEVDETSDNPFDNSGEMVGFHTNAATLIKPYLGVQDDAAWSYLGASHDDRTTNLINYIRGSEISGLRTRNIDGKTWKLGDIVHSTPVVISKPPENFHSLYGDESYLMYHAQFKDRETVVYAGANDGMLHAFTSWQYDAVQKEYTDPYPVSDPTGIGQELWAYIPQSLLPHLKWLASPDYTHVYYVDLKPKVFDAKILPDEAHYSDSDTDDNWGTILLIGLNLGGQYIWAEGDFDDGTGTLISETRHFYPSYACLDVTDPRNPRVLWERTYQDLQTAPSVPAVIRVKNKWFAVFGSGPTNCDGAGSANGHVYVIDLKTGDGYSHSSFPAGTTDGWLFATGEADAFLNSPISLDKSLNYNTDAVYFGESHLDGTWKGKVYKVTIPWADDEGNYDGSDVSSYSDNPLDAVNPWQLSVLFHSPGPITAPLALSQDTLGNVYVYSGTGRYLSEADKTNTDVQYLFGIKDPFFNSDDERSSYYHNYSTTLALGTSDLFDADPYTVAATGLVFDDGSGLTRITDWQTLLAAVRNTEDQTSYSDYYDGWIRTLGVSGERVLNKTTVLGGVVFNASFVPTDDPCAFGGDSYLYGLYYETGTAYFNPVFIQQGTVTVTIEGQPVVKVLEAYALGRGKASALSAHLGREEGAMGYIQQSTGAVTGVKIKPAFTAKSGMRSWQEN